MSLNCSNLNLMKLKKTSSQPFLASYEDARSIIVDNDHFPFTRFYRGVYNDSNPIVFKREAGWRPQDNACYKMCTQLDSIPPPNVCFQSACNTTYRC